MIDRRDFLKMSGGLMLAGGLAPWARAEEDSHMFLTIRIWGGMDCLCGLNPWITAAPDRGDLFLDDGYSFKTNVGGTEINLGHAAYAMEKHARNFSVINGIFMGTNDLGHPSAQNYITTAKGAPSAPHFIAELAEFFRKRNPEKTETVLFNAGLSIFDLTQLTRLPIQRLHQLAMASESAPPLDHPIVSGDDNSLTRSFKRLIASRQSQQMFYNKYKEVVALSKSPDNENPWIEAELVAAAAFAADRAHFAQVDWNYLNRLDSHENYPKLHAETQVEVWTRMAHLIDVLSTITHHASGKPLFPHHVTIAALTEFSRLPFLNATSGKDHDIFDNSILLAGKGVRGGQNLGSHHLFVRDARRRHPQLSGTHIDYRTGVIVKNGYYNTGDVSQIPEDPNVSLIRPENILRTMAEIFKVDPGAMRLFPKNTMVLPRIVD